MSALLAAGFLCAVLLTGAAPFVLNCVHAMCGRIPSFPFDVVCVLVRVRRALLYKHAMPCSLARVAALSICLFCLACLCIVMHN